MKSEIDWDLILKFLEGEHNQEDVKKLDAWLKVRKNRESFELIQKIWHTSDAQLPKPDVERALANVKMKAKIDIKTANVSPANILNFVPREQETSVFQRIAASKIWKIAAVILLMVISSYVIFQLSNPTAMIDVFVEKTKMEKVSLPDGTQVMLDAGSRFRYPKEFSKNERVVYLEGEGYFEVESNPTKPFMVHAGDAAIKVLGTKFNVRAWGENKRVVVAVAEGRVSFQSLIAEDNETKVVIGKDQFSIIEENTKPSSPQHTDVTKHLSWQKKEMYFQGVPLREVLDQLERWYDLEFYFADAGYISQQVTLYIDDRPINEILEMIALVNNLHYKQQEKKVIFSANE